MAPPRKRTKLSPSTTASVSSPAKDQRARPSTSSSNASFTQQDSVVADPWTPRQTSTLFKALLSTPVKPSGPHKHFNMLSIAQYVWSHEGAPSQASHLSVPGIWAKLQQLYDLPALDARETQYATGIERKGGYESGDEDVLMREVHPADEYDEEADGDEDQTVQRMVKEFSLEEGVRRGEFYDRMMERRQRTKGDPQSDDDGEPDEAEEEEDAEDEAEEDIKAEASDDEKEEIADSDEEAAAEEEADEHEEQEADEPAPTVERETRKSSVAKGRSTRASKRTSTRRASGSTSAAATPEGDPDDEDEGVDEDADESQAGSKASSPPARTRRSLAKAGNSAAATPTATTRAGSRQKSTRRAK